MKIYTLKLKTASTTNYSLYDGTTLVSDADLTTLFATEGEAYFTIDLNSLTPTNLTNLTVVNSSDTAVMTNTGLTLVDGKNFKGVWGNSATSFTSFAQLSAYGLDESQLSALVSKMGEGKIREIDVSYTTTGTDDIILSDIVGVGEIVVLRTRVSDSRNKRVYWINNGVNPYSRWNLGYGHMAMAVRVGDSSALFMKPTSSAASLEWVEIYDIRSVPRDVIDNLTTNQSAFALSAAQGKVLNDKIGDLSTLTTTAKTSTVAAINELVGSIGNIAPLSGSSAPTTSTVGEIGQIYVDTTNDKVYILKQIIEESGADDEYVWEELGGGGGSGMIELTTADYNYPANNPTSVATWLLEDGIYHYGKDVVVKPDTMGTLQESGGFVVTLTEENNQDIKKSTFSFGENNFITLWVATENGTRTSLRNIPNLSVIDNLTSTSTSDALSANQGKVLKGLVDGKATITMQTTDPGEGTTLAANSFIAVYSA